MENPYLLLTPGPLTTTKSVRAAMLKDWCTWDDDYKKIVEKIREKLLLLADAKKNEYTSVLMQGSGTFALEAVINTITDSESKILVLVNGAYGRRLVKIARKLGIEVVVHDSGELNQPDLNKLEEKLAEDTDITDVIAVHCETTTGILNPLAEISRIVKKYSKRLIVDAMSSFGGIDFSIKELEIDYLISSANKCIQGVPGFAFVIAKRKELEKCEGNSTSLSLDLFDQWQTMEKKNGKWRFTSPTHTVHAFYQALIELENEGLKKREKRYKNNQQTLYQGMKKLGFKSVLPEELQSPIITTFYNPEADNYNFSRFYDMLKKEGFVIYPGKVTKADTFRIGSIGNIYPEDMKKLITVIEKIKFW
ncbi:MAG: 2-aminoethylphosphonate--pyruvate transaminase [Halanaerobium sp.]